MTTTEMVQKSIEDLGDAYTAGINKVKQKTDLLEERLDTYLAKQGTSFGNKSTDISLKSDVLHAVQQKQDDLFKFQRGETSRLQIEVKDMSLANLTGGTTLLNSSPVGIVGATNRFTHVRDVLNKVAMTGSNLPIIKDDGATGTFTPVAEGGTKPTIDFSLEEVGAQAQVIAGIANITRQFLDDLGPAGVTNWLTGRLTEMYLIAEDDQLLNGNGVSPNLGGLNLAGNFTAATSLAADNDVVQLVTSLIQMRSLGRVPKAIVINPTNLTSILLNTASGSGEFDLPSFVSVNAMGGLSIMGVPLIDTTAQTAGTFNILDTDQMVMGIRENLKIQFFEQDGSNVRTNRITVRAEARIAFATYGAQNNIKGTF